MPDRPSRRMILLAAYEDFTRRETVCLREDNIDSMLALQKKKGKVLVELGKVEGDASEEEKADFARRISALQEQEESNARFIAEKIAANRQEYRRLSQNSLSANKLRRTYYAPSDNAIASGELKGRA